MRVGSRVAAVIVALGVMAGLAFTMRAQLGDNETAAAGVVPAAAMEPLPTTSPSPPVPPPTVASAETDEVEVPAPVDQTAAQPPVEIKPIRVRIPGIEVDADVIDLGVRADGKLEVPSDFAQTGWFTGRAAPGEFGPSIVVGHVDSKAGPAVFFRLRELEVGDVVHIERSDGLVAYFRVTDKILVDKDEFPTEEVYGSTDGPELRLVTCGGEFNRSAGSYVGNVIVFAEHLGNFAAPSPAV